jgi:acyl-CoA hydrolase
MRVNQGGKTPRVVTPDEAASVVRSGDWLDYGTTLVQPDLFDRALAARKSELRNVKIRSAIFSWHFGGYDRAKHDAGISHYIPVNLGEIRDYYCRFNDPIDVAILKARPMDENGYFNLGGSHLWHRTVVERAKFVIVEVNRNLPYVYGEQPGIHRDEIDYIIEGNDLPLVELPNPPPCEIDRAVGRLIAAEIENGSCLQIGIGGMPNAVCSLLQNSDARDLGIHTEMLTDGIIDLYKSGRVTGTEKTIDKGKIVYTFVLGSRRLYETIDRNPDFHCCPVEYTNMPQNIMRNDRVVAINNTTQIDLQGQAASESDGHRHISGTGGQLQFVRAAYASDNGKAFICLSSTYERHGIRKSRIVLSLTPGNIVTTPRSDMMYVVTEYGMVNLKGKSVADRAKSLISIAHPGYREQLEREARENNLIPRAYT